MATISLMNMLSLWKLTCQCVFVSVLKLLCYLSWQNDVQAMEGEEEDSKKRAWILMMAIYGAVAAASRSLNQDMQC